MKKLIVLSFTIITSLSLYGQSSWGITGGKLFNNFYNPKAKIISNSHNKSFTAGIFYQKPICSHSSIYASLSYEDKSTQRPDKLNLRRTDYKEVINLSYITLEAVSMITLRKIKNLKAGGGLYYSKLIGTSREITNKESGETYTDNLDDTRTFDAGINLMLNYSVSQRLSLFAKGSLGMVKLSTISPNSEPFLTCGMGPQIEYWYTAHTEKGKYYSYYNSSLTFGINYFLGK